MLDLTNHVNQIAEVVHDRYQPGQRFIVAIAGAPGSGKSTLASELCRRLTAQKRAVEVVPMDGFHLDNAVLDARNLRARKGAPQTFDGFVHMIRRIKSGECPVIPVFDRTRDIAIAGAVAIPAACDILIVEGNYLMFDETPWRDLAPLWDLTVRLDVPIAELRARLIQRWLGQNLSRVAATRRAEQNDIPNAQAVIDKALPCDILLDGQPRR
jgi:pantothenate kinase